jgi:5-methylcytosine-specific restriction enzyme B
VQIRGLRRGGRVREACLLRNDSLFTSGRPVATFEHAEALQATVGGADHSKGTFAGKLVRQLDGVEPDAIQLCAELLFVELLGEADTGGAKKAEHIETVLALLPRPLALPPEFRAALGVGGVASYGVGKNRRDAYMRFLIRLLVTFKQGGEHERAALLRDAWAFRRMVSADRTSAMRCRPMPCFTCSSPTSSRPWSVVRIERRC